MVSSVGKCSAFRNWNFISGKTNYKMVECIGSEGQIGKLKPYMVDTAMNLCDLLQQWKTQINIPPISETNHKIKNTSEKNKERYYQEQ